MRDGGFPTSVDTRVITPEELTQLLEQEHISSSTLSAKDTNTSLPKAEVQKVSVENEVDALYAHIVEKAQEVYGSLKAVFGSVIYDDNGNVGKRYRRQDEIGTPFCIVVDYDSLEDGMVSIRDRNTTEQVRVAISELETYFRNYFSFV